MNYKDSVQTIEYPGLLPSEAVDFVRNNIDTIQSNWEKKQRFRTQTEAMFSVLNNVKHPTPGAKFWQAVREQGVMYEELVRLATEYKRNDVEIRRAEHKLENDEGLDPFDRELLVIDLEELRFTKINMEATAKDRAREIAMWQGIIDMMVKIGGFDTEDVNKHQADSYFYRMMNMAATVNENTPPADAANIIGQRDSIVDLIHNDMLEVREETKKLAGEFVTKQKELMAQHQKKQLEGSE